MSCLQRWYSFGFFILKNNKLVKLNTNRPNQQLVNKLKLHSCNLGNLEEEKEETFPKPFYSVYYISIRFAFLSNLCIFTLDIFHSQLHQNSENIYNA